MNSAHTAVDVCELPQHVPRADSKKVNSASIESPARLFRALGDASRLRILAHLLDGERCVGDLAALEGEALSTISQRLRVLRTENIIARRRQGRQVNYALADRHVRDLITNALAHASEPGPRKSGEID
jgi:ArsR family transcriptional regulator